MARPTEHGAILIGGTQVASTLKCPHCGFHFLSIPGSGKRRSYCRHCDAVCCSRVNGHDVMFGDKRPSPCDVCIPEEKMLEEIERRAGMV